MELSVCFVGMGSIGARHIQNLTKVCQNLGIDLHTTALRTGKGMVSEAIKVLIDKEVYDIEKLREPFDAAFITNPTGYHFQTICKMKNKAKHLFIEKPLFENDRYSLNAVLPDKDSIYYVAAPMRFTDVFLHTRQFVNEHKVFSARIICSSYMPEWQKGRDYRSSFRAQDRLGGGVDIDLIHEIDYMAALFGFPQKVHRVVGRYSGLQMDACDLATYIFVYDQLLVEMHLDYFGRVDDRKVELYCEDDVYVGDFIRKCFYAKSGRYCDRYNKDVDHYYREMEYFVRLICGDEKKNINTVQNAHAVLRLAKGEV